MGYFADKVGRSAETCKFVLVLTLAALLSACGGGSSSGGRGPQPDQGPATNPDPAPAPDPGSKPAPDPQPEPEPEPEPDPDPEPRPEPEPDPDPDPQPDPDPDPDPEPIPDEPGPPSLAFSVSPSSVAAGGTVTLSWSSTDAAECRASGGWRGRQSLAGSAQVGPIRSRTRFHMRCRGPAGETAGHLVVRISDSDDVVVELTAEPMEVPAGESATLSWSTQGATECRARRGWSGSRSVEGTFATGALSADTTFGLTCSNGNDEADASVTVRVAESDEVDVDLTAEPMQVGIGDSSTLSWSTAGATECEARGGWSGDRPLEGTFNTGSLQADTAFSLSCGNGSENALASVTVEVFDKTISWQAPTRNDDGSPLTDLGGFVIYWGRVSRSYVGSHRITSPGVTEWEADIAPGTYYFALTAFDRQGNESDYSNELVMFIP